MRNTLNLIVGVALLTGVSCSIDRVNHRHSESNQALITKAQEKFNQAVSENTGIGPVLLKNLDAEMALRTSVDTLVTDLNEVDFGTMLTDKTWEGLRISYFKTLGINPEATNRQALLKTNLNKRLLKLQTIAKIIDTLGKGEKALIKDSQKSVSTASAALTNSVPVVPAVTAPDPAQELLASFRKAIVDSGNHLRTNEQFRASLSALQRSVLDEANASRDPASAYALVALTDRGLREKDLVLLDKFLEHLSSLLDQQKAANDATKARSVASTSTATGSTGDGWKEVQKSFDLAEEAIAVAAGEAKGRRALNSLEAASIGVDVLSKLSDENLADALPQVAKGILSAADALEIDTGSFKKILQDTNVIVSFQNFISGTNAAMALLTAAFSQQVHVGDISKYITEEQLKQINGILSDIQNEAKAGAARVLMFFSELAQIQLDLRKENARHFEALAAAVSSELKRWKTIQDFDRKYSQFFEAKFIPPASDSPPAEATRPAPYLFATKDNWVSFAEKQNKRVKGADFATPAAQGAFRIPAVTPDDQILPSIRLLAESAQAYQTASPAERDPAGFYTLMSHERLRKAVQVIQNYYFILSYNGRAARDNELFLLRELKEHNLHVDGVIARADEADIRLGLGDQYAFHSSGITDADIQTAFSIVQSIFLAWIGGNTQ
jgi:hypothetical protein